MLLYLTAGELALRPALSHAMFRDRTRQFHDRLGWAVEVDADGLERDEYDGAQTTYLVATDEEGRHLGSMRFRPTNCPVMINDHFGHLVGRAVSDPRIVECTRFCLAPDAQPKTAALLMLGGLDFGLSMGLDGSVAVFDARMERIYARLGWPPVVLGSQGEGREKVLAGYWRFDPALRAKLLSAAGVSRGEADIWTAPLTRSDVARAG